MALVFSNSEEAPAQCAMEISKALKSYPRIQVRMGVHSGPVNGVIDVNDRSNLAGAGINMAQRVMDCGDAGHILVSRHVAEDLEEYRHWRPCLHDLGECEVKHGARVHVFNLYTDSVGNPDVPEKFRQPNGKGQTPPVAPVAELKPARRSGALMTTMIIAATLALAGGLYVFLHRSSSKVIPEKSVAVTSFRKSEP